MSIRKELELRVESFVGLGWEQLGDSFLSGSVALGGGEKTACQIHPEASSDQFGENQDRNGGATLKKQEEACEILSLGAGSQSVGGGRGM